SVKPKKKSETSRLPMTKKTTDVLMRSDRVLVVALGVILAAASAAVGAAANNHPRTEQAPVAVVAKVAAPAPVQKVAVAQPVAASAKPASVADTAMAQLLE